MVGRVKVVERPLLKRNLVKGLLLDGGGLKDAGSQPQVLFVADVRVGIGTHRHVKESGLVDPVEAVKTGLVEIDEPCRSLQGVFFREHLFAGFEEVGRGVLQGMAL